MEEYDEDLGDNGFFRALLGPHRRVLERAAGGGWVVCVPRAQAAPTPPLEEAVVEAHVLVPCEEGEGAFRTLGGRGARLEGGRVLVEGEGEGAEVCVRVLFSETFYQEGVGRYQVVCVDQPLHATPLHAPAAPLPALTSLRDCVELLWAEAGGSRGLARLDALLGGFLAAHPCLEEEEDVCAVHGLVAQVYREALQLVLGEGEEERGAVRSGALCLAVESYLLHALHSRLIRCLATQRAGDHAHFNRALKGHADLQARDLGLGPELAGGLVRATLELSGLGDHTTPLGKLGCLRRAIVQLGREAGPLSSDLLLPALVVVVVRAALPTWPAQLAFLRTFRLSAAPGGGGEQDFYLSSLEAALQHVASGALLGPACAEADSVLQRGTPPTMEAACGPGQDPALRFFECVRQGHLEEVEALLEGQGRPHPAEGQAGVEREAVLCHPLCRCERCEGVLRRPQDQPWPTVAAEDPLGRTPLHLACTFGRPAVVDLLVSRGAAVEARDHRGASPLHHAAQRGHQNALLLLLHAGADMNGLDGEQGTALHLAALHGHAPCVKALLFYAESVAHRINLNGQNAAQDTPLHLASRWGHLAIVELLLDRLVALGLPLTLPNRRRLTPIECAHNHRIVRAILDARARATQAAPGGARARRGGAMAPQPHPAGPVARRPGRRPLEAGVGSRAEKVLKAVRVGDEGLACFYLGIEVVGEEAGLHPPATPLCHPLCQCAHCRAKAPSSQGTLGAPHTTLVNACDSQGRTALHEAVSGGHVRLARLLLRHGANPNALTTDRGLSPLHLAAQGPHPSLLGDLARHGAILDLADSLGNTALHLCCAAGQGEGAGLLLGLGACQGTSNLAGRSPLQEAEEYGHWGVVKVVLGKAQPPQ